MAHRDQAVYDLIEGWNVDFPANQRKAEKIKYPPDFLFRSHGLALRIKMEYEWCGMILMH